MANINDIRARLQKAAQNSSGQSSGMGGDQLYKHWDMDFDDRIEVRFLPDGNPDNTYFWQEKQVINLTFPGVKGDPNFNNGKDILLKVPCVEMYNDGRRCPVMAEVTGWFDTEMDELARKYWKKRSYLMQGLVLQDPIGEKNPPENPLRTFVINGQIFKQIKEGLLDPEMTNNPVDYDSGTNFIIKKAKNGKWASYDTSGWARNESALGQDQIDAIEANGGLLNLGEKLPKIPSDEDLLIIKEMFEASVNGEEYDPVKWGKHFAPYGLKTDAPKVDAEQKAVVPEKPAVKAEAKVESKVETPAEPAPAAAPASDVNDILAKIRNRSQ